MEPDAPIQFPGDRRVLIVGAGGMLGRAWRQLLDARAVPFRAATRGEVDITDANSIAKAIDGRHMVINCAAYTDVDGAEDDEQTATAVNGSGVGLLANRCRDTDSILVHYSTDYVFNGGDSSPYPIDAPREPLGAYGRSKLAGEIAIEESGVEYLIVRTSWLYAPWGKNFVRTIARVAAEHDQLKVVHDQVGRPGSCEHLAESTARLLTNGATGTYHAADGGNCSWYEFACEIVRLGGATTSVEPCATDEFPRPAPRPAYSVLDMSETENRIGPIADWRTHLADVFNRLES